MRGMRRAGRVAAMTLETVGRSLRAGMTTAEIDQLVRADTAARGGVPAQLGFHGFPAAVCTSRNQVVCHGVPSPHELLEEGDIVNVDITTRYVGFHGDTSRTFAIGAISAEAAHVMRVAEEALYRGIAAVRPFAHLGVVSHAVQSFVEAEGCSVVRDFGGHGIGRAMHEAPHVPHFGLPSEGPTMRPGMFFTIEPMVNLGGPETVLLDDGWTVLTADGRLSAQFEHTILVTDDGAEIMTPRPES